MSGAPTPPVMLEPIASDASSGNITNPMPDAPPGGNAASIQLGFPAITMQSELAGGKPPLGQDMNGFLLFLSSHLFALQAGQGYQFSSTVALATAMGGGYAQGAILEMADGTGYWLNTTAGNTNNPDTGGAGWVPLTAYGTTTVSSTGGILSLSAAQAKYPIIIVTGALISNLQVQLPNRLGRWLLINSTSGAFSLTALTSAGGSTGVAIPQGGPSSPVGVYCIGDGNIYPVVTPLAVAIDQNPTPATLAERTNAGYLLATYLNQNSGLENPAVGSVFVQNTSADGFLRKISLPNFGAQLMPSSAANPGYMEFPNGWILNFGFATASPETNVSDINVTFAKPFTTKLLLPGVITRRSVAVNGNAASGSNFVSNESLFGMTITVDVGDPGGPPNTAAGYWFALGV
jgi:hypothetical protein